MSVGLLVCYKTTNGKQGIFADTGIRKGAWVTKGRIETEKLLASLNINYFRRALASETVESRRRPLQRLLAEEERRLAEIESSLRKGLNIG